MTDESVSKIEQLPPETTTWLLHRVRTTINSCLGGGRPVEPSSFPSRAQECAGCFVTIHRANGDLRGCIGTFSAERPLWSNVDEMAIAAATRDPRFSPMSQSELGECVLEISVLSPRVVVNPEDVRVGIHGVAVEKGMRRGVLLPQVAPEQGWDREELLDHTCLKAGLSRHAWRDGSVTVEVFTADVFSESGRR